MGGEAAPTPEELSGALLPEFEDAQRIAERDEAGIYSQLESVKYADELRAQSDLSKPECVDAANQWRQLEEVRTAPTAVGAYGREGESITHTLISVDEETAARALDTRPPEKCRTYEATNGDGSTAVYEAREIDTAGDDSYAFELTTELEGDPMRMYRMVYQGTHHVGMTTVLGPEASEETLLSFVEAARAHEAEVLG